MITGQHARKLSFLWLLIAGCTSSSCATTGIRTIVPSNAPPDISHRWPPDTLAHQGISIGGRGFSGYEIVAAADGIVVLASYNDIRGNHIRILHGLSSNKEYIYTYHFHILGGLLKKGDHVKRGQTIGYIGRGLHTNLTHYHFIVSEGRPGKSIVLDPNDFWFGIDQYKEKLAKDSDVGPFAISCFDPSVNYPKDPIRFTYPVKCQ